VLGRKKPLLPLNLTRRNRQGKKEEGGGEKGNKRRVLNQRQRRGGGSPLLFLVGAGEKRERRGGEAERIHSRQSGKIEERERHIDSDLVLWWGYQARGRKGEKKKKDQKGGEEGERSVLSGFLLYLKDEKKEKEKNADRNPTIAPKERGRGSASPHRRALYRNSVQTERGGPRRPRDGEGVGKKNRS